MKLKELKITQVAQKLFLKHGYKKVTMRDIAEASDMSRPSLYASYANKEAVLTALINQQSDEADEKCNERLIKLTALEEKLTFIFEIWITGPFKSAIDSENGTELIANCASYVPVAVTNLYMRFEQQLAKVLSISLKTNTRISATDLAHIMMLATKGLKSSAESLEELERLIHGLIAMTLAATE